MSSEFTTEIQAVEEYQPNSGVITSLPAGSGRACVLKMFEVQVDDVGGLKATREAASAIRVRRQVTMLRATTTFDRSCR